MFDALKCKSKLFKFKNQVCCKDKYHSDGLIVTQAEWSFLRKSLFLNVAFMWTEYEAIIGRKHLKRDYLCTEFQMKTVDFICPLLLSIV